MLNDDGYTNGAHGNSKDTCVPNPLMGENSVLSSQGLSRSLLANRSRRRLQSAQCDLRWSDIREVGHEGSGVKRLSLRFLRGTSLGEKPGMTVAEDCDRGEEGEE
jgi:hypothetical protein